MCVVRFSCIIFHSALRLLRLSVVSYVMLQLQGHYWWLGSRVASVLDSNAEGPGFKSQSRRCRVTVLGKLLTPIVHLFTKHQNW